MTFGYYDDTTSSGDPTFEKVSLLLSGDSTNGSQVFTDLSQSPKAITTYGNTSINTTTKKFGTGSMYFDGTGDYLTLPGGTPFDMGTNDLTLEAWVYPTTTAESVIFDTSWSSTGAYSFSVIGGGVVTFYYKTDASNIHVSGGIVALNAWSHVAVVRSGTTVTLYVNGVSVNSATFAQSFTGGTTIYLGCQGNNLSAMFTGYLDDLRITKGSARYLANFTPPTASLPTTPAAVPLETKMVTKSYLLDVYPGLVSDKIGNTLWSCGYNGLGQLGLGDVTHRSSFVQVGSITTWKQVSCGYHYTAIKSDGTLWSVGYNSHGQLGLNDMTRRSSFVQVGALMNWKQVASMSQFATMAIKTDGTLWSVGYNAQGQLGMNDRTDRSSFVQVGSLSTWKQISCGQLHTIATKSDGTLWSCGRNIYGQLGLSDISDRSSFVQVGSLNTWKSAICGYYHTSAIKYDGSLWVCGRNNYGQLGLNDTTDRSSFVQVGNLYNWKQVAGSASHTMAIKTDGTLWSVGRNDYGALGLNDSTNRSSFVQVGSLTNWKQVSCGYHTTAIKTDGTLWTAGYNAFGSLGLNDVTLRSIMTKVGTQTNWKSIVCMQLQSSAITSTGDWS